MKRFYLYTSQLIIVLLILASCSATKFVPDGSYLLDEVKITTDNKSVKPSTLQPYVRQNPNSKWFNTVKTQLYVYNLSGRDSSKWMNRFMRKIGDAPVIYNEQESDRSLQEITKAVQNMGYMGANVKQTNTYKKKKIKVNYEIETGNPYIVSDINYDIKDSKIAEYLVVDSAASYLNNGMLFDINVLDAERQRVTDNLQRKGYYKFNKEYISYTADTIKGTNEVNLTFHLLPYEQNKDKEDKLHPQYRINKVGFITEYDVLQSSSLSSIDINDSINYKGIPIYFKDKLYLKPQLLVDNLRIQPGELYDERDVQRMYNYFGRLNALKYTNIRFFETQVNDSVTELNCYIMLTKSKHKSITFEVDGTNSAGDLGAAASVSFQHRNLFKGSETFMIKLRGAYEAITGLQGDYNSNNYTELGAETNINFPNFLFPFLSSDFKKRIRATTEFGLQYNYQLRPEFSRTVASASWSYKWTHRQRVQHRFDLLDIGYLYLPWISEKFKKDYIDKGQNHIFEYNYENRLIARMGYSYHFNSAGNNLSSNTTNPNSYSIRINIESAGNILYAISKAAKIRKNKNGEYTILSIPYAQYMKGDFDFAQNIRIDDRNSIAYHFGAGIAVPYGNARTIPFEKQYFAGGANSVRGWSVRELGPGSFPGDGNLLNQSGDIRLGASVEYRSKLFWKLQGALFIDAGNIWTIREYENQPGGEFKFNTFYKQIALAYGLGIRFDLNFFILRFDGGMKALNPAYSWGRDRWPLIHPNFKRDFAFHFAVGYPF